MAWGRYQAQIRVANTDPASAAQTDWVWIDKPQHEKLLARAAIALSARAIAKELLHIPGAETAFVESRVVHLKTMTVVE